MNFSVNVVVFDWDSEDSFAKTLILPKLVEIINVASVIDDNC